MVTTRGHIHYVVTEYGVAYLYGKNLRQRARALIDIAHPDEREHLERASRERFKVFPGNLDGIMSTGDLIVFEGKTGVFPSASAQQGDSMKLKKINLGPPELPVVILLLGFVFAADCIDALP